MKHHRILLASLLLVVVGAIWSVAARAQDGAPIGNDEPPLTKWEYRVLIPNEMGPDKHEQRRSNLESQLIPIGEDGWELVEMPYLKGIRYQVMVFKRPKR